jgi:hypothetical protein
MTDRAMCKTCDVATNKAMWENYPEMMDMCKMCQGFQDAINEAIDKQKKLMKRLEKVIDKNSK